jgi:hypothetical protein
MSEKNEHLAGVSVGDGAGITLPSPPQWNAAPESAPATDETGRLIMVLLQRAATLARDDCERAMDLAHTLASELRAAEEQAREAEAAAAHFRSRAMQAEAWLVRIRDQIEQTFFAKNDERPQRPMQPPAISAPPFMRGLGPKDDKNGKP